MFWNALKLSPLSLQPHVPVMAAVELLPAGLLLPEPVALKVTLNPLFAAVPAAAPPSA